jgi:hypothetical protein
VSFQIILAPTTALIFLTKQEKKYPKLCVTDPGVVVCHGPEDCNNNGVCDVNNLCRCAPGYGGVDCSIGEFLNLAFFFSSCGCLR